MSASEFRDGFLLYECEKISMDELLSRYDFSGWQDGFIAFSNKEKRLSDIKTDVKILLIGDNQGKVSGLDGVEGYLMEINLWRSHGAGWEEIVVERDDDGFYCQRWKLLKQESRGKNYFECRYRPVNTYPCHNSIFKDQTLESIEVIVPQTKFHFFITGEKKNERNITL